MKNQLEAPIIELLNDVRDHLSMKTPLNNFKISQSLAEFESLSRAMDTLLAMYGHRGLRIQSQIVRRTHTFAQRRALANHATNMALHGIPTERVLDSHAFFRTEHTLKNGRWEPTNKRVRAINEHRHSPHREGKYIKELSKCCTV